MSELTALEMVEELEQTEGLDEYETMFVDNMSILLADDMKLNSKQMEKLRKTYRERVGDEDI